jgi:4-amino-4-deoxy-L-arabinose transferase-like glycosyltransferase
MNGAPTSLFFHITDPLIVNNSTSTWWQPTLFYLTAAVLLVAPLAEWSVRIPNVTLALVNILLVASVARRLFGSRWYGVAAAVLLTLTPAFFRATAQDYSPHRPCAGLAVLLLARCSGRRWLLILAGLTLGVGIYTHISS